MIERELSKQLMTIKKWIVLGTTMVSLGLVGCDAAGTNMASTGAEPSVQGSSAVVDLTGNTEEVKATAPLYYYQFPVYTMLDQNTEAGLGMGDEYDLAVTDVVSLMQEDFVYTTCYHHNLFYYTYDYSEHSEAPDLVLWLWNVSTGETKKLIAVENFSSIDVDQGILYFQHMDMSDRTLKVETFDALTGEPMDVDRSIMDQLSQMENQSYYFTYGGGNHTILSDYERYGMIPLQGDDKRITFYHGTEETSDVTLEGEFSLEEFNQDYALISKNTDPEYLWKYNTLCVFNFKDGTTVELTDQLDSCLGLSQDGMAYWAELEGSEPDDNAQWNVYQYNLSTGQKDLLIQGKRLSGVGIIEGLTGFRVISNQVFTLLLNSDTNNVEWARLYVDPEGHPQREFLGVSVDHVDYLDYGTTEEVREVVNCPYCQEEIGTYLAQVYQLDEVVCEKAKEINAELLENERISAQNFKEYEVYYPSSKDECATLGHGSPLGCATYEQETSYAGFINDHLLTLDYSGYGYYGGAHGYPTRKHYLINTKTGEFLEFTDLYQGTEEEFKTIVSDAVKEDYKKQKASKGDFHMYFAEDAETAKNQAYEFTDFSTLSCKYEEQGIVVEFEPYLLSSYAAGYVEIFIPYEDLGIDLSLQ